jgi:hypothetical protein
VAEEEAAATEGEAAATAELEAAEEGGAGLDICMIDK